MPLAPTRRMPTLRCSNTNCSTHEPLQADEADFILTRDADGSAESIDLDETWRPLLDFLAKSPAAKSPALKFAANQT